MRSCGLGRGPCDDGVDCGGYADYVRFVDDGHARLAQHARSHLCFQWTR
jgi:hypothetical protein